ncbi:hypothetical protein BKI52_44770 [marine bacterium AO1-C]|nr:hypothetical protein BKI52_44770 [marine bacterium AO1-C]
MFSLSTISFISQAQIPQRLTQQVATTFIGNAHLHYFEDTKGDVTFAQVQQMKFAPVQRANNSFGFSKHSFWFRFKLQNTQQGQTDWMLEINNPLLDYLDFYYKQGNVWKKISMGDLLPFDQRPFYSHNFVIPLKIHNKKTQTYYIRVKTSSNLQLPINIASPRAFYKKHDREKLIANLEYGILLLTIIYNLFIFLSLRHISYLLYVLCIGNALLSLMGIKGYSLQYLWPNWPQFNNDSLLFFIGLFDCFFALYTIYFLRTKKYAPRLNKILFPLAIIAPISGIISFIDVDLAVKLVLPLGMLLTPMVVYTSIVCYRKGFVAARFFILAWAVLLLGTPPYILGTMGIIPFNFIVQHLTDLGFVLAVILLSLALVDGYSYEKKNKEMAQKQMLEMQKDINEKLETKVQERTQQLQEKTNETIAQNEELQQQQEEILSQNEFIATTNEQLKRESKKTQESIKAARAIQNAMLPNEVKLNDLFGAEHFVIYRPKDIVSGDFYWVSQVKSRMKTENLWPANSTQGKTDTLQLTTKTLQAKEVLFLAVVDCTGHGVPGALMGMIGHSLLNEIVNDLGVSDTNKILDRLNEKISQELIQENNLSLNRGMDVCLCKLEKQSDGQTQVTFTGSKRPLYYVNEQGLQELRGDRITIGGWGNRKIPHFGSQTILLQPGNMLYLTTDGISDAPNDQRKSFGTRRLKTFFENYAHLPVAEQRQHLEKMLEKFCRGTEQRDDITLFGLRIS